MSIIEKLGITPGPWEIYPGGNFMKVGNSEWVKNHESLAGAVCDIDDWDDKTGHAIKNKKVVPNAQLIATAPEMLEALIELCVDLEESCTGRSEIEDKYEPILQKATGKTWTEIKDLL
jgi:hypothetical protein